VAYPILKELNMKATISIIGAAIGKKELNGYENYRPHFYSEEMKEMSDSGVIDIQNHTYDLHSLKGNSIYQGNQVNKGVLALDSEVNFIDYAMRLAKDLIKNNVELRKITGYTPKFVIYPFGAYEERTEKTLKLIGFKGSVTTQKGIREYKTLNDLFEMPRLNVTNNVNVLELIENN
jgi:peptidoglycan/xylan/chitin deacetylase (PgdA/CDA1 family)